MSHTILLFGIPGGFGFILIMLVLLLPLFMWVWAIVDIIKSEFSPDNNKIVWLLIVILLPLIGTLLYLAMGRNQKANFE